MKIIVFGLVFNGPDSYLRGAWNILDIFVVIVGILVLVLDSIIDSDNIMWLRAVRALRRVETFIQYVSNLCMYRLDHCKPKQSLQICTDKH